MLTIELKGFNQVEGKLEALPGELQAALTSKVNYWLVEIQKKILAGLEAGTGLKSHSGESGLAGSVEVTAAAGSEGSIQGSVQSSGTGTGKAFPYGLMWEESGHGVITPKRARALHFITAGGEEVFTQKVSAQSPRPWFYPAAKGMKEDILISLGNEIRKVIES